jgi:hypothetical protein
MKIRLLAIAPEEGWAFFSQSGQSGAVDKIYLLRPPYTKESLVEVAKEIVEKAVFHHGFEACEDIPFDNLAALIAYMERRFVEIEEAQGKGMPSLEELRGLLEFADDDVLNMFLTRTEDELIPQRAFGPARTIATDLLRLDTVIANLEMRQRALDILDKCNQAEAYRPQILDEIASHQTQQWQNRFPNATKRYTPEAMAAQRISWNGLSVDGMNQRSTWRLWTDSWKQPLCKLLKLDCAWQRLILRIPKILKER